MIRKRKKGEGGRGRKITLRWQGVACRAQGAAWKSFCNGGEGGSQDMGCQEGVADTKTMGGFNKLATRRNLTPADLSSTEHLTVLNINYINIYI